MRILFCALVLASSAVAADLKPGEKMVGSEIFVPDPRDGGTYRVPEADTALLDAIRAQVSGKIPEFRNSGISVKPSGSALDEVNAKRAQKGLHPFIFDPLLTQGAEACSKARAAGLVQGHTANDFAYLPAGARASAAGCAAWEPYMGWGSCCTEENYTYAGAAWAMGRDGRRYMHLFVR